MAKQLLGYACLVKIDIGVAPDGKPVHFEEYVAPAGEAAVVPEDIAKNRQHIASQVLNMFSRTVILPKGWAPLSTNCTVDPVFSDITAPPFSKTP